MAMRAARSDMTADMADAAKACSDVATFAAEYEKRPSQWPTNV